jgi:hypothetical protein
MSIGMTNAIAMQIQDFKNQKHEVDLLFRLWKNKRRR